jgi:hypothetical protein
MTLLADLVASRDCPEIRAGPGAGQSVCGNFLYVLQGGTPGRSRRRLGALAFAHAAVPATAGPTQVSWREKRKTWGRYQPSSSWVASGFDKGTLAMGHIGSTGTGEKPTRFANQRTAHRPLSNPAAPSARQSLHATHAGQNLVDA